MKPLAEAYDAGVASATGGDIRIGSTTTRVSDFVNRGTRFDDVYVFPPLLEACCRIIGRPFKLSSMHARTLRTGMPAQELHVDVRRDRRLAAVRLHPPDYRLPPRSTAQRFEPTAQYPVAARHPGGRACSAAQGRIGHGQRCRQADTRAAQDFRRSSLQRARHMTDARPDAPGPISIASACDRDAPGDLDTATASVRARCLLANG